MSPTSSKSTVANFIELNVRDETWERPSPARTIDKGQTDTGGVEGGGAAEGAPLMPLSTVAASMLDGVRHSSNPLLTQLEPRPIFNGD